MSEGTINSTTNPASSPSEPVQAGDQVQHRAATSRFVVGIAIFFIIAGAGVLAYANMNPAPPLQGKDYAVNLAYQTLFDLAQQVAKVNDPKSFDHALRSPSSLFNQGETKADLGKGGRWSREQDLPGGYRRQVSLQHKQGDPKGLLTLEVTVGWPGAGPQSQRTASFSTKVAR